MLAKLHAPRMKALATSLYRASEIALNEGMKRGLYAKERERISEGQSKGKFKNRRYQQRC